MTTKNKVFLIGPMGAGKTTIGKQLAMILGLPFVDTDQVIEDRSGADIPWIFDVEGEEGFRNRETKVLADVCEQGAAVIATGGGIVMREENRALIAEHGAVVYLNAAIEQQIERTSKDKGRPLLDTENPDQVIRDLMAIRDPLYREIATIVRHSDHKSPKAAAQEIARELGQLK